NVWVGTIHGRVFYAELAQSAFTKLTGDTARRFGSGISASFMPALFPGLEIGGARMLATYWPEGGIGWPELRKPFEQFLKEHVRDADAKVDNQEASMFARWVMPANGFEAYGEFGREDHSGNGRDLILEPDHSATFGLGLRKAWRGERG